MTVAEQVDAKKVRLEREAALKQARAAERVVVARGKTVLVLDMKRAAPSDAALAEAILGPTGRLRAPALRIGQTLYVGFQRAALEAALA